MTKALFRLLPACFVMMLIFSMTACKEESKLSPQDVADTAGLEINGDTDKLVPLDPDCD